MQVESYIRYAKRGKLETAFNKQYFIIQLNILKGWKKWTLVALYKKYVHQNCRKLFPLKRNASLRYLCPFRGLFQVTFICIFYYADLICMRKMVLYYTPHIMCMNDSLSIHWVEVTFLCILYIRLTRIKIIYIYIYIFY